MCAYCVLLLCERIFLYDAHVHESVLTSVYFEHAHGTNDLIFCHSVYVERIDAAAAVVEQRNEVRARTYTYMVTYAHTRTWSHTHILSNRAKKKLRRYDNPTYNRTYAYTYAYTYTPTRRSPMTTTIMHVTIRFTPFIVYPRTLTCMRNGARQSDDYS